MVDAELTRASGYAERLAALAMLGRLPSSGPPTLGADRGFDAKEFVMELRERRVTPHVARNTSGRWSAIDGRTTRHAGYVHSQRVRKRIKEAFGWIKTIAGQARTKLHGLDRVRWSFTLAAAPPAQAHWSDDMTPAALSRRVADLHGPHERTPASLFPRAGDGP